MKQNKDDNIHLMQRTHKKRMDKRTNAVLMQIFCAHMKNIIIPNNFYEPNIPLVASKYYGK